MALTKVKLNTMVTGNLPDANIPDNITITNAGTATALQNARTINGTSFDGTANITVTSAAGTLTGNTLASGVTASSLTSVGTLTGLTVNGAATSSTLAINGSIGSHRLVVDNGTTSLNRGNSGGDILDVRGLNTSQFKVRTQDTTAYNTLAVEHGTTPQLILKDTGGSTNKKIFRISGGGDAIYFEGRNDNNDGAGAVGGDGSIVNFSLTNGRATFAERVQANEGFQFDSGGYHFLLHGNITGGTGGYYSTSNTPFGIWTNSTLGLKLDASQNASIYGNLTISNTGSSSYIDIDGNQASGEDGRIYIKGHTSSNSRAYIYFNNGQSSGGQNWFLGALRGSQNFALSTVDDYNTGTNVFAIDSNRKIGINTAPNTASGRLSVSGKIYSDTTSQFSNALVGSVTIDSTSYAMLGSNSSSRGIAICRDASASYPDFLIKSNGHAHFNDHAYQDNASFFVSSPGDSGNAKYGYLFDNGNNIGVAQVRTSGGRGLVLGRQSVSASTWTTIADTHWGGTALVAWAGSGVQGMDMVAYGYNSPVTVLYSSQWAGSQSRSYTGSTYQLQINIGTAATVWVLFLGT